MSVLPVHTLPVHIELYDPCTGKTYLADLQSSCTVGMRKAWSAGDPHGPHGASTALLISSGKAAFSDRSCAANSSLARFACARLEGARVFGGLRAGVRRSP